MKKATILPLQEAVKNIRHPTVLKMADGVFEIPGGKRFTVGDTLLGFLFTKCLNISCDTQIDDGRLIGDVEMHISLLPVDSELKFYDKHCANRSYNDLATLSKDFPRYIKCNEDFFAPSEDENLCQMKKLMKGDILELKEIRTYKTTEDDRTYTNVNKLCQSLVCSLLNDTGNVDVLLQNTLKISMISVPDTTEYKIMEIVERFQLPRKVQLCDDRLEKSISKVTNSEIFTVVFETKPIFFLGDLKDLKISPHDDVLKLCENIFCVDYDAIEISNAGVEVLEEENTYENIQPIYITKQPNTNRVQLYVMDKPGIKDDSNNTYVTLWPKCETVPAPLLPSSKQHEEEATPDVTNSGEKHTAESSIKDMNVTELCVFLEKYKLSQLAAVCKREMVDGKFLSEDLDESDLKDEPFCMRMFDIKKLNRLKTGWRPSL